MIIDAGEPGRDARSGARDDGWIAGERVRALSGERPRLKLPDRVAEVLAALRWRFQRGPIPPGLRSYTRHSWVVANDRLKRHGWKATVTNEQAYVEGTEAAIAELNDEFRQLTAHVLRMARYRLGLC